METRFFEPTSVPIKQEPLLEEIKEDSDVDNENWEITSKGKESFTIIAKDRICLYFTGAGSVRVLKGTISLMGSEAKEGQEIKFNMSKDTPIFPLEVKEKGSKFEVNKGCDFSLVQSVHRVVKTNIRSLSRADIQGNSFLLTTKKTGYLETQQYFISSLLDKHENIVVISLQSKDCLFRKKFVFTLALLEKGSIISNSTPFVVKEKEEFLFPYLKVVEDVDGFLNLMQLIISRYLLKYQDFVFVLVFPVLSGVVTLAFDAAVALLKPTKVYLLDKSNLTENDIVSQIRANFESQSSNSPLSALHKIKMELINNDVLGNFDVQLKENAYFEKSVESSMKLTDVTIKSEEDLDLVSQLLAINGKTVAVLNGEYFICWAKVLNVNLKKDCLELGAERELTGKVTIYRGSPFVVLDEEEAEGIFLGEKDDDVLYY